MHESNLIKRLNEIKKSGNFVEKKEEILNYISFARKYEYAEAKALARELYDHIDAIEQKEQKEENERRKFEEIKENAELLKEHRNKLLLTLQSLEKGVNIKPLKENLRILKSVIKEAQKFQISEIESRARRQFDFFITEILLELIKDLQEIYDAINISDLVRKISQKGSTTLNTEYIKDMVESLVKDGQISARIRNESLIFTDKDLSGVPVAKRPIQKANNPLAKELTLETQPGLVEVLREFDFIGGEIRFRLAIINKMNSTITTVKISLDIPPSLRWVLHEPQYERKGDTLIIPKLGSNERVSVALYLAPLSCLSANLQATVSFYDAFNTIHAITMRPKKVSITCPVFFTLNEVNLARVKNLYQELSAKQVKLFPIRDITKIDSFYAIILKILNQFGINLVSDESKEAWFYGETKVKKNRMVVHISISEESRFIRVEVSSNSQEQVTSSLTEINDRVINMVQKFEIFEDQHLYYDVKSALLTHMCPFCGDKVSDETIKEVFKGEAFICRYCNIKISREDITP